MLGSPGLRLLGGKAAPALRGPYAHSGAPALALRASQDPLPSVMDHPAVLAGHSQTRFPNLPLDCSVAS